MMTLTDTRSEMRSIAERNFRHWLGFIERTDGLLPAPRGIQPPGDRCAVIVETRRHPHLSYVLRNLMHFLDESWGLCIVHGSGNREFVEETVRGWGDVLLVDSGVAQMTTESYSALKCRSSFWERIPSEHVLLFQTDSLLRRKGVEDFLEYDYVGAPWMHVLVEQGSAEGPVGNGGLSLRRKSAMLRILRDHAREVDTPEDQFFSTFLYRDGYHLPSLEKASHFSTETMFQPESLGLHKAWLYHFEGPFLQLLNGIHY
jgi:hypothetical protein